MDPYKVLGVSPSASDDEIKKAYRSLVKKYHPDRYAGNKAQQDAASEKLKQINEAYNEITKMRQGGSTGSSGSYGSGYGGYGGYGNYGGGYGNYGGYSSYSGGRSSSFNDVRSAINRGDLSTAEAILDASNNRNAEWHFLKGIILLRRGWYDGAKQHFEYACNLDPGNPEYRQAYETLNNQAAGMGGINLSGATGKILCGLGVACCALSMCSRYYICC